MKKLTSFITCLLLASGLYAQDCMQYLYMQKNKTIEMTGFKKNGDVIMKSVSKVSDVSTTNGVTTATVVSESYDKKDKLLATTNVNYKCNGGVVSMTMSFNNPRSNTPQQQNANIKVDLKSDGGYVEYPSNMQVGDHLKDANTTMNMGNNQMTNAMSAKMFDRMVVAKESVTTPAGTWDCFKITYKTTVTMSLKGNGGAAQNDSLNKVSSFFNKLVTPSSTTETTIWYAPNFGMVKTETKNMMMELTAIK